MTLQSLDSLLKAVCRDTYQLAAPRDKTRYVVWHEYAPQTVLGSDTVQVRIPRVQIDILWQDMTDTLAEDVMSALELWCQSYEVIEYGYDDEYAAMRCILQLAVM